jgi:hypothetical protein
MLVADGEAYCGACRSLLGTVGPRLKPALACARCEIGDDGPWIARRWAGRSPGFQSWKYACPHCGELLAVELHERADAAHWDDFALDLQDSSLRSAVAYSA